LRSNPASAFLATAFPATTFGEPIRLTRLSRRGCTCLGYRTART
jgi:hypothetical protein